MKSIRSRQLRRAKLILNKTDLLNEISKWRKDNQTIVLTNGCFDLLHNGHLRTFLEAKKMGDLLIVGINSDRSVRALKGPTRPIINETDRAELVSGLKPVDHVIIFNETTVAQLLEDIKPNVYVKGGDYTIETLPEQEIINKLGIKVKFIPLVAGISTTELVKRIQNANF